MVTVADILRYIESIAPPYMAEDWDKIGLNCGRHNKEVRKILLALDPFPHVCREAVEIGADLVITHHPLIWDSGFITDASIQGQCVLELMEHGISHINAHTNLDCAPGGVNDTLAGILGLKDISVIKPKGVDELGNDWGLMRIGSIEPLPLEQFLACVKNALGTEGLRYMDSGKPVSRVAVGGGSCGSELMDAVEAGCDTFVTADVKYNQFWDAKALGINLIDAGHFHTENPVIQVLAQKLTEKFPEVMVCLSQKHRDCVKYC